MLVVAMGGNHKKVVWETDTPEANLHGPLYEQAALMRLWPLAGVALPPSNATGALMPSGCPPRAMQES